MRDQQQRELLDVWFMPLRAWVVCALILVDLFVGKRIRDDDGRPMTKREHEERFGKCR